MSWDDILSFLRKECVIVILVNGAILSEYSKFRKMGSVGCILRGVRRMCKRLMTEKYEGHFILVVGYDEETREVLVLNPANQTPGVFICLASNFNKQK